MKKLLAGLRIKEIVGKAGFFMVGVIFANPQASITNLVIAIQFFCLCMMNGIAIYLINAGLGYQQDKLNERLYELHTFNRSATLVSGFMLLIISLILLYLFSSNLLIPALAIYFIWTLYSLPKGLKGTPLLGLLSSFIAQILHFHIGYLVFSDWSSDSIFISIYFALLFTAGHALHEVIDFEADATANVNTSAVFFGRKKIWLASNYIFGLAAIYIAGLSYFSILSWWLVLPYLIAFGIQQNFLFALPSNWTTKDLFEYRRKYMTAYLFATGAVMLILYYKL
ncbi:MAG TPA: UbiA family prenyltransferase [Cyclobacteriaceae bacterium]|nr:UbiA family prenyltransferase [Cyclobacteriaceae bacterium]